VGGLDLFGAAGPGSPDGAWTVRDINVRARQLIESGLARVWVKGEVTGFKSYRSGHWYFSLRDAQSQIRCVMWQKDNRRGAEPPAEGSQVFVEAQPTIWDEKGEFRLTVKQLLATATGGKWQLALEQAKAALKKDGLLDPARKRPLPAYPSRIAVVTSPDGAAFQDIVSVLSRRWPSATLLFVPTRVQGDGAEGEIVRALARVNQLDADVLIVGRGGGSREDLWTFNAERVARAVAAMRMPTISAVGHETDVSLTDLVADVRAPTPSAAAEAAVPDRALVAQRVETLARRLGRSLGYRVELGGERLARSGDALQAAIDAHLQDARSRLASVGRALDALSPLKVIERGFAVPRDEAGKVLRTVAAFAKGRAFRLTVSDGDVRAEAT
jgi:exodeoxyribonuclease VII large subunit